MAEICEHFELRDFKKPKEKVKRVMSIKEAAEKYNMTVTEFLELLGRLSREGKIKLKII